eukprot:s2510_g8.t1
MARGVQDLQVNAPFEVTEDPDTPAPLPRLGGSAGDRSGGNAAVGSWQARRGSPPPVMPLDVGTEPVSLSAGVSPRPQARLAMRERQAMPRVPPVNLEAMRIGSEMTGTPASQGGSAKPSSGGWSHGPAALDEPPLVLATGVEGRQFQASLPMPPTSVPTSRRGRSRPSSPRPEPSDSGLEALMAGPDGPEAPPMDPPAGGLDMPLQPPPIEEPAFPFESELAEEPDHAVFDYPLFGAKSRLFNQDERKRWLILHALSSLAWGSVDEESGEWTLESPDPSLEPPHSSLITYSEYVARAYPADPTMEDKAREENLKLGAGKRCCFTCPGEPGTKFRPMYDQMIKNLQHSNKALAKAFGIKKAAEFMRSESHVPEDPTKTEAQNIMRFGRHQILPSFWYLLIQLTKRGRRFSVVFRSFSEDQLVQAQKELQLFTQCQHPAYNGQNKTQKPPLMDGNKDRSGCNFWLQRHAPVASSDRTHGSDGWLPPLQRPSCRVGRAGAGRVSGAAGRLAGIGFQARGRTCWWCVCLCGARPTEYTFPPYHEAYAGLMHQILQTTNTAAIVDDLAFWETHERVSTAGKMLLIDRAETKVQHIFFDGNVEKERLEQKEDAACVDVRNAVNGKPIPLEKSSNVYLHRVDFFQAVTDVEYFLKATEACELSMSKMIVEEKHAEGVVRALSEEDSGRSSQAREKPAGACQRDRPEDPIEFIAFYMLRHSKQYSKTLKA